MTLVGLLLFIFVLLTRRAFVLNLDSIAKLPTPLNIYVLISLESFIMSELLGAMAVLSELNIILYWSFTSLLLYILYRKTIFNILPSIQLDLFERIVFFIIFCIGILSFPSNWDSMSYHLPRIFHWLQSHSLEFYPTEIFRQNIRPPLASILKMQIWSLFQNHHLFFLVQFFSFYVIYDLLRQRVREFNITRFLSYILLLSPMFILQATTSQNDLVVLTFLLGSLIYFESYISSRCNVSGFLVWLSFGLAIYTKHTALIFTPALLSYFLYKPKKEYFKVFVFSPLIALLSLPLILRTSTNYNIPLKTSSNILPLHKFIPEDLIQVSLGQIFKESYLHFNILSYFTDILYKTVLFFHRIINTPVCTEDLCYKSKFIYKDIIYIHEDYTGMPILFLLCMYPLFYFLRRKKWVKGLFILIILSSFFVGIKWMPWNSRFHLLPFIIIIYVFMSVFKSLNKKLIKGAFIFSFLFFILIILKNYKKPFQGNYSILTNQNIKQIFRERKDLQKSFLSLNLKKCFNKKVELSLMANDWEYPFFLKYYPNIKFLGQQDDDYCLRIKSCKKGYCIDKTRPSSI